MSVIHPAISPSGLLENQQRDRCATLKYGKSYQAHEDIAIVWLLLFPTFAVAVMKILRAKLL